MSSGFAPFADKMLREGLPDVAIRTFAHYYQELAQGYTGLVGESEIEPVGELPDYESFSSSLATVGAAALSKTLMVKLNGGLGTSMGLERAKSLLEVKEGLCFLDVLAKHALYHSVPLVLMNSFNTQADSLAKLSSYTGLGQTLPLDFLQHKVPKILQSDLSPALCPGSPEREWCPPGHGDLYTALVTTGMLEKMLALGYEYLFVSNADNLGASIDASLLGYVVENKLPFAMEVADRSDADRKGGHLAQTKEGRLILRESAQCAEEDSAAFQDVTRHRYFNTNNLWVHLPALKKVMDERDNVLGLAMIRNGKTLDPRDPDSPRVFQLETAMGAAIAVFEGAAAVRVPRTRFAPVKTTDDLLSIRSDSFELSEDYRVVPSQGCVGRPARVRLDSRYYRLIDQMEARFPKGPPSLRACESFEVLGDVHFGREVVCRGKVQVGSASCDQPMHIADGAVLES